MPRRHIISRLVNHQMALCEHCVKAFPLKPDPHGLVIDGRLSKLACSLTCSVELLREFNRGTGYYWGHIARTVHPYSLTALALEEKTDG